MSSTQLLPNKQYKYFSSEELAGIDLTKIPAHVAVVMDGNRRWAQKTSQKLLEGHVSGADVVPDILKSAKELGVKVVTLYAFSTENWNRAPEEVAALMWIYTTYIRKSIPEMLQSGIKFDTIGDISSFPDAVQRAIQDAKAATAECKDLMAVYAMNYGARDEMKRAVQRIAYDVEQGLLLASEIKEETIANYLDTAKYLDPDLFIRTSGEHRISNFLLWQVAYSEMYFTDTLWPDFTPQTLLQAISTYQKRERRFGS
jgi:undecaprenyl diphosphate synthase